MFSPHLAAHAAALARHARHFGLMGMVYRNMRHGDYSLAALKQFYAERDLIDSEQDTIPVVALTSVEDLMGRLQGSHVRHAHPREFHAAHDEAHEPEADAAI